MRLTLVLIHFLCWPVLVTAASIPQASEVVLVYDNATVEQQGKYNFIFTVDGDDTIYTCAASRCDMGPFRERGSVTLTVYKLPDGFQRVASIIDQSTLQEYVTLAEQKYVLANISTNWETSAEGRPYQIVNLNPDGTFQLSSDTYVKPDLTQPEGTSTITGWPRWLTVVLGSAGSGVVLAGSAWMMWRKRKRL